MGKLDDKVVVVTGGGSGVGKAAALLFLKEGARVVIAGRDGAKLDAVAEDANAGDRLRTVPTDVTRAAACEALIRAATEAFGRVDVLVNNAGTNLKARTIRELTPGDVGHDDPHESGRGVLLHEGRVAADVRPQGRGDRERGVGRREAGQPARRGGVCGGQVRDGRAGAGAGERGEGQRGCG